MQQLELQWLGPGDIFCELESLLVVWWFIKVHERCLFKHFCTYVLETLQRLTKYGVFSFLMLSQIWGKKLKALYFIMYMREGIFFIDFTAHLGLGFSTLLLQYYSVLCRPSDHTVGRPRAEMRTWYGRSRRKDSNHYRPPHLLKELRE